MTVRDAFRRLLPALACLFGVVWQSNVYAQQVMVRVGIENADWSDCGDPLSPPDIYFKVKIGETSLHNRGDAITVNIAPFPVGADFHAVADGGNAAIPITIEQWDDDGWLTFRDDRCDVGFDGDALDLVLNPFTCELTGELEGSCDTTLQGDNGLEFRVSVEEPTTQGGLLAYCSHTPLWPQPGESVALTVKSRDSNGDPASPDSVEIWLNGELHEASSIGSVFTSTVAPMSEQVFDYGCRVERSGATAWSGWRKVAVGSPSIVDSYGSRVPVAYTGARGRRLDVVLYPDEDSYTGATDPAFLAAAHKQVVQGFLYHPFFARNAHFFNYWVSVEPGAMLRQRRPDGSHTKCDVRAPVKPWEDGAAVIHDKVTRDCNPSGSIAFSITASASSQRILHESGHGLFGLADQYPGDGGYFQTPRFPNVYLSLETLPFNPALVGCANDAPDVGRTEADCRDWYDADARWLEDDHVWTSDPLANDLMADRGRTPGLLDLRRMNAILDDCRRGGC